MEKGDRNKTLREIIPQERIDISELIPLLNFKLIEIFYQNEFKGENTIKTNWDATNELKSFSKWIEKAYKYLRIQRPPKEKEIEKCLDKLSWEENLVQMPSTNSFRLISPEDKRGKKGKEQRKLLNKIEGLEAHLFKKDTKILKNLIKYRKLFWT